VTFGVRPQGRVRFRQVIAGLASTGQSLKKVKGLLEGVERGWLSEPAADSESRASANGRLERIARAMDDRLPAMESWDGSSKLFSGERRILTALAQYAEGRSKVQVAVLTGYAATGGGFNNAVGRLRTLDLVQGRGELRASDNLFNPRGGLRDLAKTMERVKRIFSLADILVMPRTSR
jgi:hypothetical protein